jgi:hypothetical protein
VHNVASDAHDDEIRRAELSWAFERLDGELPGIGEQAEWFTRAVPSAIVAGTPLPVAPEPPAARRAWIRVRRHAQ